MLKLKTNLISFEGDDGFSFHCLLMLVIFITGSNVVLAEQKNSDVLAEIVWVDRDKEKHQLMLSQLQGDEWGDSIVVYGSSNSLVAPAMGTSLNGDKLLIWTEQVKARTILKMKVRLKGSDWSEASVFTNEGTENFAASIVYDVNGDPWVFWSSARSALSDIYMAKSLDWLWTKPVIVNVANEVPDIHPRASINERDQVHIEWTRYSFEQKSYIDDETYFDVVKRSDNARTLIDQVNPSDIPLANFLPDNRLSLLHFPSNAMLQSQSISR